MKQKKKTYKITMNIEITVTRIIKADNEKEAEIKARKSVKGSKVKIKNKNFEESTTYQLN